MSDELEFRYPISPRLSPLRELVRAYGSYAGLSGRRLDDLVLAVNEAAVNVLEHARGTGWVRGRCEGDDLVVELVDEAGTLTAEHLAAGPAPLSRRGLGLWVIRRLTDHVSLDHPEGRTRLRLYMRRPPDAPAEGSPAEPRMEHGGTPQVR